jgi:hypothetical protein
MSEKPISPLRRRMIEDMGARIGLVCVLHTWGSTMTHHPHVHMIVPGGGISLDGKRWVSCRPKFFLAAIPPPPITSPIHRAQIPIARAAPPHVPFPAVSSLEVFVRRPRHTQQRRRPIRACDCQTNRTSNPATVKPTTSNDQSPKSRPRSRPFSVTRTGNLGFCFLLGADLMPSDSLPWVSRRSPGLGSNGEKS